MRLLKKRVGVPFFNGRFFAVAAGLLLGILLTRALTLMHGAELHPDEWVFYDTVNAVLNGDFSFQNIKPYPNGAFVLQLPFHALGRVWNSLFGAVREIGLQGIGRFASVAYFALGSLLGLGLVWRVTNQNSKASICYALIMVFGLLHLEQSRYGTADPVTFFLFMLLLALLLRHNRSQKTAGLLAGAAVCGALAACKFPLVLALALPLALVWGTKGAPLRQKALRTGLILLCLAAGFVLCTPALFSDIGFIGSVIARESGYVLRPSAEIWLQPLTSLGAMLLYQLLYAGFPLAPVLCVLGVVFLRRGRFAGNAVPTGQAHEGKAPLFTLYLPVFIVLFLVMNLMASVLRFRSLYPYFCLCAPYVAMGAAGLWQKGRVQKALVAALALVLTLRGALFVRDMHRPSEEERTLALLRAQPGWNQRTGTVLMAAFHNPIFLPLQFYSYPVFDLLEDTQEDYLRPGEFLVSGAVQDEYIYHWPFAHANHGQPMAQAWDAFKAKYAPYAAGRSVENYNHALYGAWVYGSTLGAYEFPHFDIYTMPAGAGGLSAEKRAQYEELYTNHWPPDYFPQLAAIQNARLILTSHGDVSRVAPLLRDALGLDGSALPPLAPDENCVLALDANKKVLLAESGSGTLSHSFSIFDGHGAWVESGLRTDENGETQPYSSIQVDGRSYTRNLPGFDIAVFDEDAGCVMEWLSITLTEDGSMLLLRYA